MKPHRNTRLGHRITTVGMAASLPLLGAVTGGILNASAAVGDLSGTAFRDYNANGVREAGEVGVQNVGVTAFDTGTGVFTTETAADGTYSFSGLVPGAYRLEFTGLPAFLTNSAQGPGSRSSVQFVTDNVVADFAVQNPGEYCQANPEVAMTCFVNGVPVAGSGLRSITRTTFGSASTPTAVANADETGPAYALAYQRGTKRLFSTNLVKRHVGYYENPVGTPLLGQIFSTDMAAAGTPTTPFVDLEVLGVPVKTSLLTNSARGLGAPGVPSDDPDPLTKAHKYGLLDMAITEDDSALFVVSGIDNNIYQVKLPASGAAPVQTDVSRIGRPPIDCVNGELRTGGLAVKDNQLYAGFICDASVPNAPLTDLTAQVWTYSIAPTPGWATTPVLEPFTLIHDGCNAVPEARGCNWTGWTDTFPAGSVYLGPDGKNYATSPQPVLSDLAIAADGSLVLGIRDRFGDISGRNELSNGAANGLVTGVAGGDILKACRTGATFTIEGSGSCTTTGAEFYTGDNFTVGATTFHDEVAGGAVLTKPGSNLVMSTFNDPSEQEFFTSGIRWFDSANGSRVNQLQVEGDTAERLGKSNGMGQLTLLCDQAPIEIGNRIWDDSNNNGRQDPSEGPLAGIQVLLRNAAGATISTVTTDANGNYLFSSAAAGTGGSGAAYGLALPTGANFSVAINTVQAALSGRTIAPLDAPAVSGDTTEDDSDNDFSVTSGFAVANVPALKVGSVHTFDAGFFNATTASSTTVATTTAEATTTAAITTTAEATTTAAITTTAEATTTAAVTTVTGSTTATTVAGSSSTSVVTSTVAASTTTIASDPSTCGSVGNYIWLDTNNNARIDAGEAPLAGISVRLVDASGNEVQSTTTSSTGYYLFSCVKGGSYKIRVIPPSSDFVSSNPTGTETQISPNIDWADNDDQGIQIGAFIESASFAVGNTVGSPSGEPTGGLTDSVPDVRSNLTVDFGLTPRATVIPAATTTTVAAGSSTNPTSTNPTSTNPAAGTPTTTTPLVSTPRANTTPSTPVTPGKSSGVGALCSEIFVDTNQDGIRDADEPALGGVGVGLTGPNGIVKEAVSDRNGSYCFESLPDGDYTVTILYGVPAQYSYLTDQSIQVRVLGATAERPTAVFRVAPLAFTGNDNSTVIGGGIGLLLGGAVLVRGSKQKGRHALA